MTADEKSQKGSGSICTDQPGKLFIVVGQDARQ